MAKLYGSNIGEYRDADSRRHGLYAGDAYQALVRRLGDEEPGTNRDTGTFIITGFAEGVCENWQVGVGLALADLSSYPGSRLLGEFWKGLMGNFVCRALISKGPPKANHQIIESPTPLRYMGGCFSQRSLEADLKDIQAVTTSPVQLR